MPYTYAEVADILDQVKDRPTFQGMSVGQFAKSMKDATGSNEYDQGLNNNLVNQFDTGLNKLLKPVGNVVGQGTGWVANQLGASPQIEDLSRKFGEELPRGIVNFAPLAVGGLGYPLTAALSGAQTYGATGSKTAAAVSGGMAALLPKFAETGQKLVDPLLRNMFYKPVSAAVPDMMGGAVSRVIGNEPIKALNPVARWVEEPARAIARQAGAAVNQEATVQGTSLAANQQLAPYDTEHMFNLAAGVVPFSALDVGVGLYKGGRYIGDKQPGRYTDDRSGLETAEALKLQAEYKRLQPKQPELTVDPLAESINTKGEEFRGTVTAPVVMKPALADATIAKHFNKVAQTIANSGLPKDQADLQQGKNMANAMAAWLDEQTHTQQAFSVPEMQKKFNATPKQVEEALQVAQTKGLISPMAGDGTVKVLAKSGYSTTQLLAEAAKNHAAKRGSDPAINAALEQFELDLNPQPTASGPQMPAAKRTMPIVDESTRKVAQELLQKERVTNWIEQQLKTGGADEPVSLATAREALGLPIYSPDVWNYVVETVKSGIDTPEFMHEKPKTDPLSLLAKQLQQKNSAKDVNAMLNTVPKTPKDELEQITMLSKALSEILDTATTAVTSTRTKEGTTVEVQSPHSFKSELAKHEEILAKLQREVELGADPVAKVEQLRQQQMDLLGLKVREVFARKAESERKFVSTPAVEGAASPKAAKELIKAQQQMADQFVEVVNENPQRVKEVDLAMREPIFSILMDAENGLFEGAIKLYTGKANARHLMSAEKLAKGEYGGEWETLPIEKKQEAINVRFLVEAAKRKSESLEHYYDNLRNAYEQQRVGTGTQTAAVQGKGNFNPIQVPAVSFKDVKTPKVDVTAAARKVTLPSSLDEGAWGWIADKNGVISFKRVWKDNVVRLNTMLKWVVDGDFGMTEGKTVVGKGVPTYVHRSMSYEDMARTTGFIKEQVSETGIPDAGTQATVDPKTGKVVGGKNVPGKKSTEEANREFKAFVNEQFLPRLRAAVQRQMDTIAGKPVGQAQELSQVRMPRAKTDAELKVEGAAEEANIPKEMVAPVEDPLTLAAGLGEYFRRVFGGRGTLPTETERLANIATKMALHFSDIGRARVAKLVGNEAGSATFATNLHNAFIAINPNMAKWGPAKVFVALVTGAHEMGHLSIVKALADTSPKADAVLSALKYFDEIGIAGRHQVFSNLYDTILPDGLPNRESLIESMVTSALKDSKEGLAELFGLHVATLASPDTTTKLNIVKREQGHAIAFSEPRLQQFLKEEFLQLHTVVDALVDLGTMNGMWPKELANLKTVLLGLDEILTTQKEVDHSLGVLNMLRRAGNPAEWNALIGDGYKNTEISFRQSYDYSRKAYKALDLAGLGRDPEARGAVEAAATLFGFVDRQEMQKELGIHPYFYERFFMPSAQLSATYPQLNPVFDLVRTYRSMANELASAIAAPILTGKNWMGKKVIDADGSGAKVVINNPKANKAFTRISLAKQSVERVLTDGEMRAYMKDLSPEVQNHVIAFDQAVDKMMVNAAEKIKLGDQDSFAEQLGAMYKQRNKNLTQKESKALGSLGVRYYDTLYQEAASGQMSGKVDQIRALLDSKVKGYGETVLDNFDGQYAKLNEKWVSISDKPWFRPEIRLGKFHVSWKEPNVKEGGLVGGDTAFETFQEASAYKNQLKATRGIDATVWDKYDRTNWKAGIHPGLLERVLAMEKTAQNSRIKTLPGGEALQSEVTKIWDDASAKVYADIKAQGVSRYFLPRKLAPGRETINSAAGVLDYIQGLSTGLAKRATREAVGAALMDPELVKNPKLRKIAEDHYNNVINPPGKEWSFFKNLNFGYFLGFNFSSMMIESTQSMVSLVPQLTRDTNSVWQSYKALAEGANEIMHIVGAKGKYRDADLEVAVKRMEREGKIGFGIMGEFNSIEENSMLNVRQLLQGGQTLEKAALFAKPIYWYLNSAKWLYSNFTQANSLLSFITAYKLGKGKLGMDSNKAYEYAAHVVDRTMYGGGAAARPVGFFHSFGEGKSDVYGAAGTLYSLSTYTAGMMGMMLRFGRESISKNLALSSTEKTAARKAFGQMMLTQMAIGGAMGMPVMAGLFTLIEEFSGLPIRKNVRQATKDAIQATFDSDDDTSRMFSDIALKGAPTVGMGVDISSRVSLANLLGLNTYNGFSAMNMLGPTGGVISNIYKATQGLAQGEPEALKGILPRPWQNMMDLYRHGENIMDAKGNLVHKASEYEQAMYAIGFKPKGVMEAKEQAAMIASSEKVEGQESRQFYGRMAEKFQEGKIAEVKEELLGRQKEYPMFDAREGAKQVVDKVLAQTIPRDYARTGSGMNARNREEIAALFESRRIPEVKRLMMKTQLERQIGIPGGGRVSPQEMQQAQMVDQLMQMQNIGPAEARKQLELMRPGANRPRLF